MQDLERDGPVVPNVVGEKDGGHASASQLAFDPIPIGQRRLQAIQLVGHGCLISSSRVPWQTIALLARHACESTSVHLPLF
jgi:hypothetical protein